MTKVNQVVLCPSCKYDATGVRNLKFCPSCGCVMVRPKSGTFGVPDYLSSQKKEVEEGASIETRVAISREFNQFIDLMSFEDTYYAMMDAYLIMRQIPASTLKPDHLKTLIKVGIRIGEMSIAIDKLIKTGGKTRGLLESTESASHSESEDYFGGTGD